MGFSLIHHQATPSLVINVTITSEVLSILSLALSLGNLVCVLRLQHILTQKGHVPSAQQPHASYCISSKHSCLG